MQIKNECGIEGSSLQLTPTHSANHHQDGSDLEESEGFGSYLKLKMQHYDLSVSSSSDRRSQKNSLYNEIMAEVQMNLAEAQKIIADERPFFEQPRQKPISVISPKTPLSKSKKPIDKLDDKETIDERSCSAERIQKTEKKMRKSFIIRKMGSSAAFKEGHEVKTSTARLMLMTTIAFPLANLPVRLNPVTSLKTKYLQSTQATTLVRETMLSDDKVPQFFTSDANIKDLDNPASKEPTIELIKAISFEGNSKRPEDLTWTNQIEGKLELQTDQHLMHLEGCNKSNSVVSKDDVNEIDTSQLSFDIKRELEFTQKRLLEIKMQEEIENENAQMRHEVGSIG